MSRARPGDEVTISYDGDPVVAGDALQTPTGRSYGVIGVRVQTKGKHRGRQFVTAVVLDEKPGSGTKIHPLVWYSRNRKR